PPRSKTAAVLEHLRSWPPLPCEDREDSPPPQTWLCGACPCAETPDGPTARSRSDRFLSATKPRPRALPWQQVPFSLLPAQCAKPQRWGLGPLSRSAKALFPPLRSPRASARSALRPPEQVCRWAQTLKRAQFVSAVIRGAWTSDSA